MITITISYMHSCLCIRQHYGIKASALAAPSIQAKNLYFSNCKEITYLRNRLPKTTKPFT